MRGPWGPARLQSSLGNVVWDRDLAGRRERQGRKKAIYECTPQTEAEPWDLKI